MSRFYIVAIIIAIAFTAIGIRTSEYVNSTQIAKKEDTHSNRPSFSVEAATGANTKMSFTKTPIEGLFGLKLGQVVTRDLAKELKVTFAEQKDNYYMILVTPPVKFSNFTHYYLKVMQKSGKIASIGAIYQNDDNPQAVLEVFDATALYFHNTYGKFIISQDYDPFFESESSVFISDENNPRRSTWMLLKKNFITMHCMDAEILMEQ